MEVELSQAQSPMRVIVLAPGEPNPFSVADDPDVTPAWVSMGLFLPLVVNKNPGHR